MVGLTAALCVGCNGPNSGKFTGNVVGLVSNAAGTCVSATSPELQSAPGVVCLDQRIARVGDCVEIEASTPAMNESAPLLFAGALEKVLPRARCSAPTQGS